MEASEVGHMWREDSFTKTTNGRFVHDDDDSGPETDVDGVHDVLSSGFTDDTAKAKALVALSQTMDEWLPQNFEPSQKEFLKTLPWTYADALKKPKPKSPEHDSTRNSSTQNKEIIIFEVPEILEDVPTTKGTPENKKTSKDPKDDENVEEKIQEASADTEKKSEETGNDVAEAELDSADDSEEEWNYIPGRNNKKTEKKQQQVETAERPSEPVDEEDDMSQLNPNAAEFVPVFGPKVDTLLASSPAKGSEKSLEDVQIPKQEDFLDDISTKPSELDDLGLESRLNNTSVNGIDAAESSKLESDESNEDDKVPQLSNPFSEDKIQHQMVSDYFDNDQSLGFRPFDPMQDSMVVLDSTPSPSNPAGQDLYDLLSNSDKPDLLSPIDNLSCTNNEQQKSSSSGFESESGNEIEIGSTDRCDLVAGIPLDNNVDEIPVVAEHEYPETNPFSANQTAEVVKPTEQSMFFGEDKFEPVVHKDSILEDLEESKPPSLFSTEIESEMKQQLDSSNVATSPPVDVDLICGTATADSNTAQMFETMLDFTKNFEQSISEVPNFEYSAKEEPVVDSKEVEDVAKEVEVGENEVGVSVVEEKSKDDSAESDFEIISHDDAELNHVQEMNGGVHLEEMETSPDNFKFDCLPQQHTVEVHAEQAAFETMVLNPITPGDFITELMSSGWAKQDEQIPPVNSEIVEETVVTSTLDVEPTEETAEVVRKIEPVVEETAVDLAINDLAASESKLEELAINDLAASEPKLEELAINDLAASEPKLEELASPVDDIVADVVPAEVETSKPIEQINDFFNDVVQPAVTEIEPVVTETQIEADYSLLVTPSAPVSEDLVPEIKKESLAEAVTEDVVPNQDSLETPNDAIEEIRGDDFVQQNGHVAEVSTPPSTPAPGVEPDNKDGLIAAAVAAAGVATVAAAAVATADAKVAKVDEKATKKPAAKPLSSARPSSAKVPAKPATTAAPKKPAATSAVTKASSSATKTTAAKPLGAAKPAAAKPASPMTKTATSSAAAKPKPTSTTAAAKPIASKTVGDAAKSAAPTTRTAPASAKAPLTKPKTPTTATPAPIKKPTAAGTVTKTTAPVAAKKPEPAKAVAAKPAPATRTVAAPRPTSASKPTSTVPARPASATKTTTRPTTSTTTKMAAPSTTKPATTSSKPAATKPTTTPAPRTSTASKTAAPAAKPTAKTAPPKPKPAAPTVLKKTAAPDKTAAAKAAPKGPIKRPVADKTKPSDVKTDKEPDKTEPPMQEAVVTTTNGHIDFVENGVNHDESPIEVNSCSFIEAQN